MDCEHRFLICNLRKDSVHIQEDTEDLREYQDSQILLEEDEHTYIRSSSPPQTLHRGLQLVSVKKLLEGWSDEHPGRGVRIELLLGGG